MSSAITARTAAAARAAVAAGIAERVLYLVLRRPLSALATALIFSLAGLVSLQHLPLDLLPPIGDGGLTILTRHPGVPAARIEESITIPMERQISSVVGITGIQSVSRDGESRVNLSFAYNSDMGAKILEVSEQIDILDPYLPSEALPATLLSYDPTQQPVFIASFHSEAHSLQELGEIVDRDIKPLYERHPGVSEVTVGGALEREISISIDPSGMNAYPLSPTDLARALAAGHLFLPNGEIGGALAGERQSRLYTDLRLKSIKDLKSLSVATEQERIAASLSTNSPGKDTSRHLPLLPLRRLAQVARVWREPTTISRTNGEERVALYVYKAGHAATLAVSRACLLTSNQLAGNLQSSGNLLGSHRPPSHKAPEERRSRDRREEIAEDIAVDIIYDRGRRISESISFIARAALYGSLLVIVILYIFLRRPFMTIIAALAIPASLLSSFFLMFLTDLNLNLMSLCGLALGIGVSIDNSIVVIERIIAGIEAEANGKGQDKRQRPKYADIGRAVLSAKAELLAATLTSIVVFVPLLFAVPETKILYQDLALAVSFSLICSLVFSLFVLPALIIYCNPLGYSYSHSTASQFKIGGRKRGKGGGSKGSKKRSKRGISKIGRAFHSGINSCRNIYIYIYANIYANIHPNTHADTPPNIHANIYEKYMARILGRQWLVALVLCLLLLLIPFLFWSLKKEFIAPLPEREIAASLHLKSGTGLEHTLQVVKRIEDDLEQHPAISRVSSRIEKSRAWFSISLRKEISFSSIGRIMKELRRLTERLSEGTIHYSIPGDTPQQKELDIEFFGGDIGDLKSLARSVAGSIEAGIDGVDRVLLRFREARDELLMIPNREKMATVPITPLEMGTTLRYLLSGIVAAKRYDQQGARGGEIDLRLRGDRESLKRESDIARLHLPLSNRAAASSSSLPLSSWVDFERGESDSEIWRKERRRMAAITVKLEDISTEQAAEDISGLLATLEMPADISFDFGKQFYRQKRNQKELVTVILVSTLLLYLLLAALLESLLEPLFILLTLPLAFIGALLLLISTDTALSLSAYIGLIMVSGIAVNNSILVTTAIREKLPALFSLRRDRREREGREGREGKTDLRDILIQAASSRIRPIVMTTLTSLLGLAPMILEGSSNLWYAMALTVAGGLFLAMPISLSVIPLAFYILYRHRVSKLPPAGSTRKNSE